VEFLLIDLAKGEQQSPEFLAINPNGKIPVLADGNNHVWKSNAVICYLADKEGSNMWPKDRRQIDIVRWMWCLVQAFSRVKRYCVKGTDPAGRKEGLPVFRICPEIAISS